ANPRPPPLRKHWRAQPRKAEFYLARRIDEIRNAEIFGNRPDRSFRRAATKFLLENQHKRSIGDDAMHFKMLDPFIGELSLRAVHRGSLQSFVDWRKKQGVKTNTINLALKAVRRVLNLASSEWLDENGLTWLERAPKITMLKVTDARKPYPLSFEEQDRLFKELSAHLARMALFKVNTGCREQEVCGLRWHWEFDVPEMKTSLFLVPGDLVKNGEPRLIVLNRIAKSVIEEVRGEHPEFVFTHRGKPVLKMNNSGWKSARVRVGLKQVRVHDLKHTFGRRLRAANASFTDRQDLLGHKSTRITDHYSAAELENLVAAANSVCGNNSRKTPALVLLREQKLSA
ncbi:MAG: tyrosine-type recombinase/integrase, partial [Gammaproteobacteria bacterium]